MSNDRSNPFGSSDLNNNLKTPLIEQERHGVHEAIHNLSKSLTTFQQHIDKASNLSKRIGTNRDNQQVRDQIHAHIDDGRALTSQITVQLKDFLRFVSEVSGSERVRRCCIVLFVLCLIVSNCFYCFYCLCIACALFLYHN